MWICNGIVFLSDGQFHQADIRVQEHRIAEISEGHRSHSGACYDASGRYVLPGLCDIHTHGAAGFDFSDADEEGLRRIAAYERSVGVTSFCPTSMTLGKERLRQVFQVGGRVAADEPTIVGFHMEGPFINPRQKGAQKEEDIRLPELELFQECDQLSGGRIRQVTIAPEMEGALAWIDAVRDQVQVSIGHTNADYECALTAMQKGATHVTHLYNAMPLFHHRAPGVVGAALDVGDTVVELIADGVHVDDAVIRGTFRLFAGRVALISDSMRATGLGEGTYTLGGQTVTVSGRLARLSDGTIAGSVTHLFDGLRHAIQAGIPKEEAIAAATIVPARSIGVDDEVGSIEVGKRADMVVVDEALCLVDDGALFPNH